MYENSLVVKGALTSIWSQMEKKESEFHTDSDELEAELEQPKAQSEYVFTL